MTRIAIIAAMEREVAPLVRSWKMRTIEHAGRRYRLFENGDAALVCSGIGAEAARRATEAVIREVKPVRVISVGFAGALNASLQVGDIFEPRTVINTADGARTDVGSGEGILVSCAEVGGKGQKNRLSKAYGASAVDMEAAAVAQGAEARGIEFGALKVVSDAAEFDLPALDRFVGHDGTFHSVQFAYHVALRPWLWATTVALARNSSKASHALGGALDRYLDRYLGREGLNCQTLPGDGLVSGMNENQSGPMFAGAHTSTGDGSHTRTEGKQ
jgi:adenosylhomocysteine nucleosidase